MSNLENENPNNINSTTSNTDSVEISSGKGLNESNVDENNNNNNNNIHAKESIDINKDVIQDDNEQTLESKNFDTNFEKELDQIETSLSTLSENFKKRRLSKNEMDFLESEMNLDIENITDTDFDIHLRKLMTDNVTLSNDQIQSKSSKLSQSITQNDYFDEKNLNEETESNNVDDKTENKELEKNNDAITDSVVVVEEEQDKEETEKISTLDEDIKKLEEATKQTKKDVEATINETNESRNNESESVVTNGSSSNSFTTEKTNTSKETESMFTDITTKNKTVENKNKEFDILTTTTETQRNTSIPLNSELLHDSKAQSALDAYRSLINDSNRSRIREVNHVNAQLSALPLTLIAPDNLSFNVQMLINTLPVLDNLATQILRIVAKGPYQKIMELVSNRESYTGIAFSNLVELFETTKRIYSSEESPFFTVENITFGLWKYGHTAPTFLHGREDTIEGTLRKVNLSTFLLATLGLIDLGFFFLNEAFLDVFCPPQNLDPVDSLSFLKNNKLYENLTSSDMRYDGSTSTLQRNQTKFLKAQAILYLELKTQAYISAIELGDRSKEDIIHDLFPKNMDEILLRRKDPFYESNGKPIERNQTLFTPAELDFLNRCDFRKQTLLKAESDSTLMEKYEWIKFLNDLLEYVSKNVGFLIWGPKGKMANELNKLHAMNESFALTERDEISGIRDNIPARTNNSVTAASGIENNNNNNKRSYSEIEDSSITENRSYSTDNMNATPNTDDKGIDGNSEKLTSSEMVITSTMPTTLPKSKPKKAKHNRPSTFRRIWTAEEENALKEGLKKKGTHWTAILELYGPGGQINESLKNRSSLQLKDKARNWKIYYIKNNLPVPDYLQKATGDSEKYKRMSSKLNLAKREKSNPVAEATKSYMMDDFGKNDAEETQFNENDVYDNMFGELLPNPKDKEIASKNVEIVADDAVASELKDLVAEAFK